MKYTKIFLFTTLVIFSLGFIYNEVQAETGSGSVTVTVTTTCSTPLTQTVTVECDLKNGVAAISGSVTRKQTKSDYPGCAFGTPITADNSTYISDDCKYPPTCSDGIKNQNETGIDIGGECTNNVCPAPLTKNTGGFACDKNANGDAAISGSVTRGQTKSAYPSCTFETPVTVGNSYWVSDNCEYPTPDLDQTPRIALWAEHANQHTVNGVWKTDPDGLAYAAIFPDLNTPEYRVGFCKKYYGNEMNSSPLYKNETITTWMSRWNADGPYTYTVPSYKCIVDNPPPSISVDLKATLPGPLTAPGATNLSWTTTGSPTSCDAAGTEWSGTNITNGSAVTQRSGMPAHTYVFKIVCHKAGVTDATDTVTVVVNSTGTCSDGIKNQNETGIDTGGVCAVNGSCSSPAVHYICTTGTKANPVDGASAWTWKCNGFKGGTNASCTENKVCANGATNYPTCTLPTISVNLSASPVGPLTALGATNLSWTTTGNPTSCDAAGTEWSGTNITNGSAVTQRSGMPAHTYVFKIVCHKAGVTDATDTVTVVVNSTGTCSDGIKNQNETGIDTGGVCETCGDGGDGGDGGSGTQVNGGWSELRGLSCGTAIGTGTRYCIAPLLPGGDCLKTDGSRGTSESIQYVQVPCSSSCPTVDQSFCLGNCSTYCPLTCPAVKCPSTQTYNASTNKCVNNIIFQET